MACVPPAGALGSAPFNSKPRVLRLEYSAGTERGALRLTVGDPDGQIMGIRLGGAVTLIADGTGCGPRNGHPTSWVLPIRRLEPGVHSLQVFLTSSTCLSNPSLEESQSDFTITMTQNGGIKIAGQFGDPFVPPPCRVGEERPSPPIPEGERADTRVVTPPVVIGCGRVRPTTRRFELVAHQQIRGGGASSLCIRMYSLPSGIRYGCGTNGVRGGGNVDISGVVYGSGNRPVTVSGATTHRVARVTVTSGRKGRRVTRTATLVRVRSASLLRRLKVARAFGHYLVQAPRPAGRIHVRAYDRRGRQVGSTTLRGGRVR
jgi:hypothetical protein